LNRWTYTKDELKRFIGVTGKPEALVNCNFEISEEAGRGGKDSGRFVIHYTKHYQIVVMHAVYMHTSAVLVPDGGYVLVAFVHTTYCVHCQHIDFLTEQSVHHYYLVVMHAVYMHSSALLVYKLYVSEYGMYAY
jgi:hypothetical protein